MKYKMGFAFVCMVICLFAIAGVFAGDANENLSQVDNHNDGIVAIDNAVKGNFTELANSIENASQGSVLSLDKDYEYDAGNVEGITINKSMTVDGRGHILDGANASRMFLISHSNVTLKNLIFKNGFSDDCGGAIHLNNSTLLMSNCTFINNMADVGGGALYASQSNVSIAGSSFSYNCGEGLYVSGGAVNLFNSSASISDSGFFNNAADAGGALYGLGSSLNITGSEFSDNVANFYGGGIFFEFFLKINSTVFHDNRAGLRGGGIHISYLTEDNGILEVNNSMLLNNNAHYGGAVSTSNGGHNLILNSKIYSNTATYGAVIARVSEGSIEIDNCECRDNKAVNGTVVYAPSCGNVALKMSNFTNNSGEYGCLVYTIQGRTLMKLSDYNITVFACNASDNRGVDSLIYNFYGNVILNGSSFAYQNGQYQIFVIKKFASGNVSIENNWWGAENPDLSRLIYVNGTVQNQVNNLSIGNHDDDCSSNVIQIDENHTVSSYRRDSSKEIPLIIGGDGEVRQEKSDVTFFFHMIVTANGWVLGNGGRDMPYLTEKIEGLARKMIEKK